MSSASPPLLLGHLLSLGDVLPGGQVVDDRNF